MSAGGSPGGSIASTVGAMAYAVEADNRQGPKGQPGSSMPPVGSPPQMPSPGNSPRGHHESHLEFRNYLVGPRDPNRHTKWPLLLQMHGSILPKMIIPLLLMGAWATCITLISKKVHPLEVNSVLLTVTGFVVSMGLSFRSSTAYERYSEGRRLWASLSTATQALGRMFWIHTRDPENEDHRQTLLNRVSAMNLLAAFSVALKYDLRFEPYTYHHDLHLLVNHLNTFARTATEHVEPVEKRGFFRSMGEYLGVSFAASNPRKLVKRAEAPLGNLPLEILSHIALAVDFMIQNGQLKLPIQQTIAYNNMTVLNDVLTGCQRVLNTPLPVAYSIAISQITWVYVMLLPFQLVKLLSWIAIPATVAASYIILGLLMIGHEIENPFGTDVNDLPLDSYCEQIQRDLDIIASHERPGPSSQEKQEPVSRDKQEPASQEKPKPGPRERLEAELFLANSKNVPLYPVSQEPWGYWMGKDVKDIRDAIKTKPNKNFEKLRNGRRKVPDEEMGKEE